MSEPSVMTYTKLLRQPTAICSCCGKSQYPGTALVYTDNDSRVDWEWENMTCTYPALTMKGWGRMEEGRLFG